MLEEEFKQREHKCFDVPVTKKRTDRFHFRLKLKQAAIHGCTDCLDKLIKAGANVNKTEKYNFTALKWASRHGHPDSVKLLLKAGADLYITDEMGHNALSHAVNRSEERGRLVSKYQECLDILLRAIGDEVNSSPEDSQTPLMSVAAFGHLEWLRSLIAAGADVNKTNGSGNTALMKAAARGHLDCISTLLNAGADMNRQNIYGGTALMIAISRRHSHCIRFLLNAGADVNVMDKDKWTALTHAASRIDTDCITWLLEAGAEVKDNVNDTYIKNVIRDRVVFFTPEELANRYRCIQLLLKIGGYINQSDETALEHYVKGTTKIKAPIPMLLLVAGETLNKRKVHKRTFEEVKELILKNYMKQEGQDKLSLKHLSREAVRKQMIRTHRHDNLFQAIPRLGIPSMLELYLVYDVSLDAECYSMEDFVKFWKKPVERDELGEDTEDENSEEDYYNYEEDVDDDDNYYYNDSDEFNEGDEENDELYDE